MLCVQPYLRPRLYRRLCRRWTCRWASRRRLSPQTHAPYKPRAREHRHRLRRVRHQPGRRVGHSMRSGAGAVLDRTSQLLPYRPALRAARAGKSQRGVLPRNMLRRWHGVSQPGESSVKGEGGNGRACELGYRSQAYNLGFALCRAFRRGGTGSVERASDMKADHVVLAEVLRSDPGGRRKLVPPSRTRSQSYGPMTAQHVGGVICGRGFFSLD